MATAAADLGATLRRAGLPFEPTDLMIAATALAQRLTFVTRNVGRFERVPGLAIENRFAPV